MWNPSVIYTQYIVGPTDMWGPHVILSYLPSSSSPSLSLSFCSQEWDGGQRQAGAGGGRADRRRPEQGPDRRQRRRTGAGAAVAGAPTALWSAYRSDASTTSCPSPSIWTTPSQATAPSTSHRPPLRFPTKIPENGAPRREIDFVFSNSGRRRKSSIPAAPVSLASIPCA